MGICIYRKSSVKPLKAYLISEAPEEGLLGREIIHKSSYKDLNDMIVLLNNILLSYHTILRVKVKNSRQILSQTVSKLIKLVLQLNDWKIFGTLWRSI